MAIFKITYSAEFARATLHHDGCNFRCLGCTYKLASRPRPQQWPTIDAIHDCLRGLELDAVHFMGGEPTTNPQLPELLAFCKRQLGVATRLGHTNGSGLVLQDLDGSNVSFKAFDERLHRRYTGHPAAPLYANFRRSYEAGLEMRASTVFNPEFGGLEQVEKIAAFVGGLDRRIPFHVLGYIPVPGCAVASPHERGTGAGRRSRPAIPRQRDVLPSHLRPGEGLAAPRPALRRAASSLT